ncbi:copper ABC transporter permease [Calidifontibacillus erzurumensis]|uniref:Copper ABC transporter permease n=1 Tax=Calidifontibacillus erzurumensis TaxID=2741433 RepID=A0A8J8GDF9_9BACI|nr:copper ABC transporter permease [Calidifontibacillus erzurumensis]NSL51632.1 copper ABC transporter permease [Calidifontibacillus erzurumensis]
MNYIWKEWKEQSRGKGIWLALSMIVLLSFFILLEGRSLPTEHGFTVFLLSLFEMNMFILPLLSIFIASFSIIQEKELKTLMILTTKKESFQSFLYKKSLAVQAVVLGVFALWYFVFAIFMTIFFHFNVHYFISFLLSIVFLLIIFNQIGIFLGSICNTRMQLIGANIFTWFFFVYLVDLLFLYLLPTVSYENVQLFSIFYFLDPIHTIPFYLETSLGVFSLDHMSRLMEKMVWASPVLFLVIDCLFWVALSFGLSVLLKRKG